MPNAAGMIYESIWRDEDWRKLSRGAQALYMQLLSQKELDCAGLLPLQPGKWAKGCSSLTTEEVWSDLDELQDARFVCYDTDTDEALVRTHIRNSNVIKIPNSRRSAVRAARLCASLRLRAILADELRATGRDDFIAAAEEINPSPNGSPNGSPNRYLNPSPTVNDLLITTVSEPLPEPLANPRPNPRVLGTGTRYTHLGNNSGGEQRRPTCARHPNGNHDDENCRGCMKSRQWDEQHAAESESAEIDARRRARAIADACPDCHGTNTIDIDDNTAAICQHPYAEAAHA